ncbi:MAG: YifB family Mg chelatase-like AAA ATPase [Porticoccaceae bacterium]
MSLAIVRCRSKQGINAPEITVEVHLSNGLPSLNIVGLPETAVRESKDRVRSALINAHFEFPARRITINLAPADIPKEGSRFDLPIALGILVASGQLPANTVKDYEFIGELALTSELRPVDGVLPTAIACGKVARKLLIPLGNVAEASLAENTEIYGAQHLLEVCAHLRGAALLKPAEPVKGSAPLSTTLDLEDVIGQHQARRALEIAASGNHNLLFSGSPGTGKTLLASRIPTIMPPLDNQTALEVSSIYSVAGMGLRHHFHQPPFRAPHHTASAAALVGGGSQPNPGEISLAHAGVLFLDELPEFPRKVLEVLREPMESGEIHLSRVRARTVYPARFLLVAAMNPCQCGLLGTERCRCTPDMVRRYKDKISGPLLDRIDLQVQVNSIPSSDLVDNHKKGENSAAVRARVIRAREVQLARQGKVNGQLSSSEVKQFCVLGKPEKQLITTAIERLHLSGRAYHRVLKVARTIADLRADADISTQHLAEALGYRFNLE